MLITGRLRGIAKVKERDGSRTKEEQACENGWKRGLKGPDARD